MLKITVEYKDGTKFETDYLSKAILIDGLMSSGHNLTPDQLVDMAEFGHQMYLDTDSLSLESIYMAMLEYIDEIMELFDIGDGATTMDDELYDAIKEQAEEFEVFSGL